MLTDLGMPFLHRLYDATFFVNTRVMQFERYLAQWLLVLEGEETWPH